MHIPENGLPKEDILAALQALKGRDLDWKSGKVWGYVYNPGDEPAELIRQAYGLFLNENALDPGIFPSLLKLETQVVRMVINLLRGDANAVGHVTTGGTESILLAVKTARDKARAEKPHIREPEMILPKSAHGAFHKAAHILGVRPVLVDTDPHTFRARPETMRAAITPNTVLMVASAPSYSQGVIDPIREIGAIAQEYDLLFHVDACVGGVYLSYLRQLGYDLPAFDFTVPGVTSISTDLHKYAYAAKGCSLILQRSKELRKYQIFACSDTTAYTLTNPTMLNSRSGGHMAAAWAILNYLGDEGYRRIVRDVQAGTRRLIDGINAIPGLYVLGQPDMCMFSFASDEINVYELSDEMRKRGWAIQAQFSTHLTPRNLHLSVSQGTLQSIDRLLSDLGECVEIVRRSPGVDCAKFQRMVDAALECPDEATSFARLAALAGLAGADLPTETAFLNEVLDALPDAMCNAFLVNYFNDLYG